MIKIENVGWQAKKTLSAVMMMKEWKRSSEQAARWYVWLYISVSLLG
jgi:hypothetical protein